MCAIATANAARIESLWLEWADPMIDILELQFPRLKRLRLEARGFHYAQAFIRKHAHQLETLSSFFGFVPPSVLDMAISKLDLCCRADDDALLLRAVISLPPTVTRIALDLSSKSPHALDLLRAAGARLYRLTLAGSDIEASELEAALRPCISLRSAAMELEMCLAAAAAGCPVRQVHDCNIGVEHLRALTSLRQAYPTDTLAHADQIPPSLPHLRTLGVVARTADAVPLLRRLLHAAPRLDSLTIALADEWHADHVAVLHEMCALAHCKLSELTLDVRASADVAETLRPQFRAYRWLSVSIHATR